MYKLTIILISCCFLCCAPPANVKVVSTGSTYAVISFNDNCTGYCNCGGNVCNISYHKYNEGNWNTIALFGNRDTIKNLQKGTMYFFRVQTQCCDSAGFSAFSKSYTFRTNDTAIIK